MPAKRSTLPKRLRFEIFKRDAFTCMYCGRKAPDALLHVDHVNPVSKGGTDDPLNLVTACDQCNLGKSDVLLSDTSTLELRRKQMEALQERQEQISMMLEWHGELAALEEDTAERFASHWVDLAPGFSLNQNGIQELRRRIKRFGEATVLEAMNTAAREYLVFGDDCMVTEESWDLAWKKIGGICNVLREEEKRPGTKRMYYICGIIRNRFGSDKSSRAMAELKFALQQGSDPDDLEELAKSSRTWREWQEDMERLCEVDEG